MLGEQEAPIDARPQSHSGETAQAEGRMTVSIADLAPPTSGVRRRAAVVPALRAAGRACQGARVHAVQYMPNVNPKMSSCKGMPRGRTLISCGRFHTFSMYPGANPTSASTKAA